MRGSLGAHVCVPGQGVAELRGGGRAVMPAHPPPPPTQSQNQCPCPCPHPCPLPPAPPTLPPSHPPPPLPPPPGALRMSDSWAWLAAWPVTPGWHSQKDRNSNPIPAPPPPSLPPAPAPPPVPLSAGVFTVVASSGQALGAFKDWCSGAPWGQTGGWGWEVTVQPYTDPLLIFLMAIMCASARSKKAGPRTHA